MNAQGRVRIGIFCVADHHPEELPRTLDKLYCELLELGVCADALGFDSFWVAEHHFHSYGVVPRPAVLLSAVAARTRRIRLGAAVSVLPLDNPVRTAEDFAMLDVISSGRLEMGVGSGYLQHELAGFSVPAEEKRERFDEALTVIRRLWTGEAVTYRGKHCQIEDLKLNVLPLQKPEPPIWIAGLRAEAVPHIAARGMPMLLIPYASCEDWDALRAVTKNYYEAFSPYAENAQAPRLACGLHTHCAPSNAQAQAEAEEPLSRYVRTRLFARRRSLAELHAKDLIAVGDAEHILQIINRYAQAGVTELLLLVGFGGFPQSQVLTSLERIARDVLPRL